MFITQIDRYILRYFLKSFGVLGSGFVGVLLIGIFIDQFHTVSALPTGQAIGLLLMQIPQFLQPILPLCILIATMMTFWTLIRQSELTPMRATGQSVWRFFRPLFFASFGIGFLYITLVNPLSVFLNKQGQEIRFNAGISSTNPFSISEKGFWLKEKGEKNTHIVKASSVKQVDSILYFENPTVFFISHDHIFESRMKAERGRLTQNELIFENTSLYRPGEKREKKEFVKIKSQLTPHKIRDSLYADTMISFWELPSLISFLKRTGFNTRRHVVLFSSFLFFPFLLGVFSLLGMAFSISKHIRHTRFFIRIALGIATGFGLFFADKITLSLTTTGVLPLFLGLSGTALIAFFLSVSFLLHSEDG
ncbi:MAG: LptF/LptG family permease [Alphaproteobacteria bacterium]